MSPDEPAGITAPVTARMSAQTRVMRRARSSTPQTPGRKPPRYPNVCLLYTARVAVSLPVFLTGTVMFEVSSTSHLSKAAQYEELLAQARALLTGETDWIANAANFSALVFHSLSDLNWAGFYFHDGRELVVGPFQGKPACVRIPLGKGVCGTAAQTRETQVVRDVHAFAGHIACDSASQSEIVVPLVAPDGTLIGVWDVDSPVVARFDEEDAKGMEALCAMFIEAALPRGA
jgi:GAF domain-containing protein